MLQYGGWCWCSGCSEVVLVVSWCWYSVVSGGFNCGVLWVVVVGVIVVVKVTVILLMFILQLVY